MTNGLYTRFLFAYLIPGATLVCTNLLLVNVPVEEGYRISLLEWSMDSDRVFPYLVAVGLIVSAVLGSLAQATRMLLVDRWALRRHADSAGHPQALAPPSTPASRETPPQPAAAAGGTAASPVAGGEGRELPMPAPTPRAAGMRRPPPGPLAEMNGNLALALLVAVIWVIAKIVNGGGTEIFPRSIAFGVPLAGLAACALLFAAYWYAASHAEDGGQGSGTG